jgi:excisionase family DNA binding protein
MPTNPPAAADLNQPPGDDLRWMSTRDAAAYLGITPRTVYKLIDTDQLRAYRFGRVIRIRGGDLDTFIDSARIQPGTLAHLYPDTPDLDDVTEDEDLEDEARPDDDTTDKDEGRP